MAISEITDKYRIDFIEKNYFDILILPTNENGEWVCGDGYGKDFHGRTIRDAIDKAILNTYISRIKL